LLERTPRRHKRLAERTQPRPHRQFDPLVSLQFLDLAEQLLKVTPQAILNAFHHVITPEVK
jgi:hypothetical protein